MLAPVQIFNRTSHDLIDRLRKSLGQKEAGGESAQQHGQSECDNFPAQRLLFPEGGGEWIKANVVGGRKSRFGIERLVKKKMRAAFKIDNEMSGVIPNHGGGGSLNEEMAIGCTDSLDVKLPIEPEAAFENAGRGIGCLVVNRAHRKTEDERTEDLAVPIANFCQNNFAQCVKTMTAANRDKPDVLLLNIMQHPAHWG